jgi:transmembrane sensor
MRPEPLESGRQGPVEQAAAWCLRLSEGSLTTAGQDSFDTWLESDDSHRQAFDDAIRIWRAVERAGATPELVNMRTGALATFRRGQRARWRSPRAPRLWQAACAAVAAALVVGIGALWLQGLPRPYQTAVGERRVVVLSDGSKVSLDAATKVEVRYRADRRELRLDYGRAKFTVAKNLKQPFTVAVADKIVLATGTEFSVELVRGQVRVILYQGHVAVLERAGGMAPPARVALAGAAAPADKGLAPGRELIVPVAMDVARVVPVDTVSSLSWEGGQLIFVDEPLSSAVERVNRYSKDKLSVGDSSAGRVLVSGVFAAGDTSAFLEGVTGIFPVKIRDQDGQKVLVYKNAMRSSQ